MKKGLLFTAALLLLAVTVQAQNDAMYFMKNGFIINKQSIKPTDVDSIVFNRPTVVPETVFMDSRDSNVYEFVTIGDQVWMAENLKYLPSLNIDGTNSSTEPYYYVMGYYESTVVSEAKATANYNTYGVLYNGIAAATACPKGWHLPSNAEWETLIDHVGGAEVAGGKLKETGFDHWNNPNTGATNEFAFNALPGGTLGTNKFFSGIKRRAYFWTSTKESPTANLIWYLDYGSEKIEPYSYDKTAGLSIRCVKDKQESKLKKTLFALTVFLLALNAQAQNDTMYIMKDGAVINQYSIHKSDVDSIVFYEPLQTVTDIEGNVYRVVIIGDQFWMAENLKTTKYNDGTKIPQVTANEEWETLTSGAYSWFDNMVKYKAVYGALYNWYAVGTEKLCPIGWVVPSKEVWADLRTFLGGSSDAVNKLREIGSAHWVSPYDTGTDEVGFTALPGGYRINTGGFYELGKLAFWWSSTEEEETKASYTQIRQVGGFSSNPSSKTTGYSVRCIMDKLIK